MVLHVTYLRCTVRGICMLFFSVKLLDVRVAFSDRAIAPPPPLSRAVSPPHPSLCLLLCQFLKPEGEALLVLFFEVCVIWTLCPQCNSSIAISCTYMYIHGGETQQPYKREIKTCPNLMLYIITPFALAGKPFDHSTLLHAVPSTRPRTRSSPQ